MFCFPPISSRVLPALGLGLLLSLGIGWGLRKTTDTLVVGLRMAPHPTGALACVWNDGAGEAHLLPAQTTAQGRTAFHIPCHATGFRFIFSPSATPYQIQHLTFYRLPLFSAQWLNNMVNPETPVYTQQYMGPHDTLEISAPQGAELSYIRFFNLLLHVTALVHSLALPICVLMYFILISLVVFSRFCRQRYRTEVLSSSLRLKRYTHTILPVATFLTLCLTIPPPVFPTHPGCDPSWNWLLNYFALNPLAVGSSIFFTYGPLGFTLAPQAMGHNVVAGLICNLGYAFCYAVALFAVIRCFQAAKQGVWLLLLCMVLLPSSEWRLSVLILFLLFLCARIPCKAQYTLFSLTVLLGLLIVYATLVKFTLAITSGICVITTVLYLVFFCKKKLFVFLPVLITTLALGFLFASLQLFSEPRAILDWARISWEVASGYNTSMVTQVSTIELLIPVFLVLSYLFILFPLKDIDRSRLAMFIFVSPLIFFSFKYSITRAGIGNCRSIAYVFPFVTAMLFIFSDTLWRPRILRLFVFQTAGCVALSILAGIAYQTSFCGLSPKNLFSTLTIKKNIRTITSESEQALLPMRLPQSWRSTIGTNTFSSFPTELTYVPANGLNFVSFPIIQGYSAYTRELDQLGARLYASENAPTWVLCEFAKTDQRNGMIDTPAVWNAILTHYQCAGTTNNLCLMRKRVLSSPSRLIPIQTKMIAPGTWLDLPTENTNTLYMSIHWPQSISGRLLSLVFRNTFCSLTVERKNQQRQRWRLTADTAQTPFSLDAIPFTEAEFCTVLSDTANHTFRAHRILLACEWPFFYSETITAIIYQAESDSVPAQ